MKATQLVLNTIKEYNMISPGSSVLVCVSGGADSMCLLNMLWELRNDLNVSIFAAHYNHNIRGEESDGDEEFVREYCKALCVPLFVGSGDVTGTAKALGKGVEETARTMRYEFFYKTAEEHSIGKIATAHNSDDNLETLLLRMCRGTGLLGMCGIPPVRDNIIRPLLALSRQQIEAYLEENHVPHREDSTNASDKYSRNKLRHHVMPVLRSVNPEVSSLAYNMTEQFRRDNGFLEELADRFIAENYKNGRIDVSAVLSQPYPVVSRAVRRICGEGLSYEHIGAVYKLCRSESPSDKLSLPGLTLHREYGSLVFGDNEPVTFPPTPLSLDGDTVIEEIGLKFTCENDVFSGTIYKSFTSFLFKSSAVCGKIVARPRILGDTIVLSEKAGTKSLKKLFIEKKIPAHLRGSIPVIADDAGPIAIPGIGCSVRVRPQSGDKVLKVKIEEIKRL